MGDSFIFAVTGYADMGEQIISINKPGPQEIFSHLKNGFKYTRKKSCEIYFIQWAFYPGIGHPLNSDVGDID